MDIEQDTDTVQDVDTVQDIDTEQFEDIEQYEAQEDLEYLKRREQRRRRHMQERIRRERKLRLIKFALCVGVLCIVSVFCIIRSNKKINTVSKEEQESIEAKTHIQKTEAGQAEISSEISKMAEENGTEGATEESTETETAKIKTAEEPDKKQDITEGKDKTADAQSYKFESTSDTMNINSEDVISSNAILVDADSDTIIAAKGAYDRISPASMTKVLTVLVAAETIDEQNLEDTFTMTTEITDYAYVNDCSSVGFLDGEAVTIKDLFYGTVLKSGGDAAVGLAVYTAGSHEAFVDMMNEKLKELGIADSAHFTNCVGIYDADHYCSVYDMAVIMKAAMQNEWCKEVLSAHTYTTVPTPEHPDGITISNWFLRRIEDKDTGGLVVGGKTGYVVQSGNCAVSYEKYINGTPYICVTTGATSSWRCIYDHVEIYNRYI